MQVNLRRVWRRLTFFVFVMLVIEFTDEVAYSALEAARPLIRDAFALNYVQVGLITSLPVGVAILVEPIFGLFGDGSRRRVFIVGGAALFGLGLIVQGLAPTFVVFLLGATLQAPASGVFVNLAQASLMDDAPDRRENRMALWTASGSLAVVVGPLLLAGALSLQLDWRAVFVAIGVLALGVALLAARLPNSPALRSATDTDDTEDDARLSVRDVLRLLRRLDIWRWLVLLQFSDLMLDVLFSLLALYLVDVAGVNEGRAAVAVALWTGVGLIGDLALIPLLERVRGLVYLRFSAGITLLLYPAFLMVSPLWGKLVLLGLLGLFNAGWYAVLQSKVYDALGEQSGAVLIVGNAAGVIGVTLPLVLGWIAVQYGLSVAMWTLLAGPIALLIGLPRSVTALRE
ncbi:MAG: MFS transporter [Chloroflexota bacterium]